MHKDVESFVKRCQACMRNNKENPEFHPAIAITADSVWDNLVVDTTWGYPLTDDGYHGVLTIIDRVSHFPFAWALKSKNASEIVEKIFDLICLISPFKCLHSDNGTEIKNKLMERLLEVSGISSRYGSSYSPRSQGLIESFNRILAESIRKCAEADSMNWPKYLNFVLLAYRTKINEATKLSPYELVFARKPNHFENWSK
jgi:transposase InsO family protein